MLVIWKFCQVIEECHTHLLYFEALKRCAVITAFQSYLDGALFIYHWRKSLLRKRPFKQIWCGNHTHRIYLFRLQTISAIFRLFERKLCKLHRCGQPLWCDINIAFIFRRCCEALCCTPFSSNSSSLWIFWLACSKWGFNTIDVLSPNLSFIEGCISNTLTKSTGQSTNVLPSDCSSTITELKSVSRLRRASVSKFFMFRKQQL